MLRTPGVVLRVSRIGIRNPTAPLARFASPTFRPTDLERSAQQFSPREAQPDKDLVPLAQQLECQHRSHNLPDGTYVGPCT